MVKSLGLTIFISGDGGGGGDEAIITSTLTFGEDLTPGSTIGDITGIADIRDTANYSSSAGLIDAIEVQIDGVAALNSATIPDGSSVRVVVTDDAASPPFVRNIDPAVVFALPIISGVPTIAGTAQAGEQLTATPASVSGGGTITRTWQWFRDGAAISGATSSTYTLVQADVGAAITVRQTETNSGGSSSATSAATAAVAQITAPTISISPTSDTIEEGTTGTVATISTSGTGITVSELSGNTSVFEVSGSNLDLSAAATPGNFSITLRVTDTVGQTADATFSLEVTVIAAPTVGLSGVVSSLSDAAASGTFVANITGGTNATLSLIGTDAASLQISGGQVLTDGAISAGTLSFAVRATGDGVNTIGTTDTATQNITVNAAGIDANSIGFTAFETAGNPGNVSTGYTEPVPSGNNVRVWFQSNADPLSDRPDFEIDGETFLPSGGLTAARTEDNIQPSGGTFTGQVTAIAYIVEDTLSAAGDYVVVDASDPIQFFIAPALSAATGTANGSTGIFANVTTSGIGGTLYRFVSTSATPPNAATLKAGTGAVDSGSQTVSADGVQNATVTGLTASTGYYIHFLHELADSTASNILSTAEITTAAAATAPAAMTSANWSLAAAQSAGGDKLNLTITAAPADGGSAITDYEYRLDSGSGFGSAISLGSTARGTTEVTVLADTQVDVQVRAVNAVGNGAYSASQTETPLRSGGSTATSVVIDGRTFTFGGSYSIVRHVDGPVAIVSSSAVTVTPPAASSSGRDGAMKNPTAQDANGDQGFDSRRPGWNASLNVEGGAVSLSPGDVLLASKSHPNGSGGRDGTSDYQMIYVTTTAPDANSLAPAAMEHGALTLEAAPNWATQTAAIQTYSVTNSSKPTFGEIINRLTYNPGWAHFDAASSAGYEWATPYLWGGPDVDNTNTNWGGRMIWRVNESIAALMDNSYSAAERQEILIRLASAGKQLWISDSGIGPDGGHYQPHPACVAIYLWATGQISQLADMMDSHGGNWIQAFQADASYIADMAPFGSPNNLADYSSFPFRQWTFHRRNISSISGNRITLPTQRAFRDLGVYRGNVGDGQKGRWNGLRLTDGSSSFLITDDLGGDRGRNADTVTVEVPGHTFSPGDTVWMEPNATFSAGDYMWGVRGGPDYNRPHSVILNEATSYQKDPRWTTAFLFLHAVGAAQPKMEDAIEFMKVANQSNTPSSNLDWQYQNRSGTNHDALWQQHGSTILAITQPAFGVTPDTTAPIVTLATGTQTGTTTATWGATSDEAGGTMFAAVRLAASAALTKAEIENGTGNAVATDTDATPTADANNGGSFTGLTASTSYVVDVFQRDAASNESTVASSASFSTAAADSTAPTLSSPAAAEDGSDGATSISVSTNEGNGTLYWGIYADNLTPTNAQVKAGTNATVSGSQAVSGTGTQNVADQTGLTDATAYKVHFAHEDAAANLSAVASSATFTTSASAAGPAAVSFVGFADGNGAKTFSLTSGNKYAVGVVQESGASLTLTTSDADTVTGLGTEAIAQDQALRFFEFTASSTGNVDLTNTTGGSGNRAMAVWDVTGWDFQSQASDGDNSGGGTTPVSVGLTTLAGDTVLGLMYAEKGGTTLTLDNGFTVIDGEDNTTSGSDRYSGAFRGIAAGGSPETFGVTLDESFARGGFLASVWRPA